MWAAMWVGVVEWSGLGCHDVKTAMFSVAAYARAQRHRLENLCKRGLRSMYARYDAKRAQEHDERKLMLTDLTTGLGDFEPGCGGVNSGPRIDRSLPCPGLGFAFRSHRFQMQL